MALGAAPSAVAHDLPAAGDQILAAQEVCARAPVAGDERGIVACGRAGDEGPARGAQVLLDNLPAAAALQELAGDAHRRYAVEQFHEEADGELGWDPLPRATEAGVPPACGHRDAGL
jgi:hypothetical protein